MSKILGEGAIYAILRLIKGKSDIRHTHSFGDVYANKEIYSNESINMGRKAETVVGQRSVAFGDGVEASGDYSHAEGCNTIASGLASYAEGRGTTASGKYSHTKGENTVANKNYAYAEGLGTAASGLAAHAEGIGTKANYTGSHTEGMNTIAGELGAHAEGINTEASNYGSHACGKYNKAMRGGGGPDTQVGDVFVIGNGTRDTSISCSNALRVTYQGEILGTGAFQSSGADYAEFIAPWADNNPDSEDRVGYFVTVKDGLLCKAGEGDYIAGVTSGNPSVVGNADEDYYWRYERDEFNRIVMEDVPETVQATDEDGNPLFDAKTHEPIMEETGQMIKNARMKLSADYESSLQNTYIPRKDRSEWDYVGMVGVLPVRDDGTCLPGQYCKCADGGIATLAENRAFDAYMVTERISGNIVKIILK